MGLALSVVCILCVLAVITRWPCTRTRTVREYLRPTLEYRCYTSKDKNF